MADVTCDSEISTLSSVYSEKNNHHHHHHHDHNRCNRYKTSGTVAYQNMLRTLDGGRLNRKRGCEHLTPRSRGVSMATQVINPKAIGGSLKFGGHGRMLCQRYYPGLLETGSTDSDLFSSRKRIPWDKLACYALSSCIILALLTGIVIAAGYMQSEKHRILSEKLQGDPMLVTTWRPTVRYFTKTTASDLTSSPLEAENNTVHDELIDPPIQTNDTEGASIDFSTESDNNELEIYEIPADNEMNESTLADADADDSTTRKSEQKNVRREQKTDSFIQATATVSADDNNGGHTAIAIDQHKPPAEVKVLPPKGFNFRGFSLEIPIYNQDNSTIESYNADYSSTTRSPDPNLSLALFDSPLFRATPSNSIEILPNYRSSSIQIITPASLNTDLFSSDEESDDDDDQSFDGEMDSEMSATSGRGQVPISRPSDNMYTPRPGTNPVYPDRPLFSSHYSNQEDDKLLEKFSSNRSEVRMLPPTSTTTPRSAKASESTNESVRNNAIEAPTLETTTTVSPLIEYQIGTPSSISTSFVTSAPSLVSSTAFEFDFSQLTTLAPATATGPASLLISPHSTVGVHPESLSKRTFNFDFDTSAATNPFANILGNQAAVTGAIGSATSTGASLGLQNQFNFDNYFTYQPLPPLNLPSGTVPIDLASSYIQVGGQKSSTQSHSSGTDYSNLYSHPTTSFGQNGGSFGQNGGSYGQNGGSFDLNGGSYGQNGGSYGQNGGSYGQNGGSFDQHGGSYGQNGGSFNQHGASSSNHFPSVTTSVSNPNPPSYNTITQGIHLLSLLSGSIPQHLVDTQTSASSFNEHEAKPELQIAALAGYGGSAGSFLSKIPDLSTASSSIQSSSSHNADLYSSKSLPEGQSTPSSFGRSIVSKLAEFSNVHNQGPALDSMPSASEFLEATSPVKAAGGNERSEKDLRGLLKLPQSKETTSPSDSEVAASEDQQVSLGKDYISLEPRKPTINFAKKLMRHARLKTESTQAGSKGLKSGFYT